MSARVAFESWMKKDTTLPMDRNGELYADMHVTLMWHAWKAAIAVGRYEAASAAAERVRATVIVDGEAPERMRWAIAQRVSDVGKPTAWADGLCVSD